MPKQPVQRPAKGWSICSKKGWSVWCENGWSLSSEIRWSISAFFPNTVFNINSKKKVKLYTDWLTLDEHEWLSQVFESPEVYLYRPDVATATSIGIDAIQPVTIIDTEVVLPNERSSMKRLEITAEYSNKRITQGN